MSVCEPEAACFLPHLQIKVGDLFAVHEADSFQNLLQEVDGLVLRQVLLLRDEVEKLPAADTKPQTLLVLLLLTLLVLLIIRIRLMITLKHNITAFTISQFLSITSLFLFSNDFKCHKHTSYKGYSITHKY